jgi:hypothetical protein
MKMVLMDVLEHSGVCSVESILMVSSTCAKLAIVNLLKNTVFFNEGKIFVSSINISRELCS